MIGILSDTHDKVDAMRAAIAELRHAGSEFYIHCGDVGTERIVDLFAGLPGALIWGNNDWERASLDRYAKSVGVSSYGDFADLILDGKRFAVVHGDDLGFQEKLLRDQQYDYLLHGHTHLRRDDRFGRTRIINPGALYRTREKSVAVLDTSKDLLKFFVV